MSQPLAETTMASQLLVKIITASQSLREMITTVSLMDLVEVEMI